MPRICLACLNPDREGIDKALVSGEPLRNIAKRVSISPAGLLRHKKHVAQAIVKASSQREEQLGVSLVDQMCQLQKKAWELLGKTESEGDHRGSIVALREVRECLESLGDMLSKANTATAVQAQTECWDYSRLSDEELRQIMILLDKAYVGSESNARAIQ